jgi:hypothetical protein
MAKQTVNVGTTDNDGTGSTIRAGGTIINANFTEIYNAVGDGTNIAFDVSGATSGQSLVYNNSTGKFEPGAPSVASTFTVVGDGGSNQDITTGDNFTIQGGTGITTTGVSTDILSVAVDSSVVATITGTQTFTNKTLTSPKINENVALTSTATELNLLSGITSLVTASSTTTFTNKTFDADATGNSLTNIEDANIKSGAAIDASKIHDGTISNTEFGYLNGVTSNIQDQINAAGLAFAIALGGE